MSYASPSNSQSNNWPNIKKKEPESENGIITGDSLTTLVKLLSTRLRKRAVYQGPSSRGSGEIKLSTTISHFFGCFRKDFSVQQMGAFRDAGKTTLLKTLYEGTETTLRHSAICRGFL